MKRIERFGLIGALLERLGDLQHRHRAAAVVVGAVVDRIGARAAVQLVQRVDHRVDATPLGGRERLRTAVGALRLGEFVEHLERIMIDGRIGDADVVVVRADRDVLAAERRVGTGENRDDVPSRTRLVDEPHVGGDRLADRTVHGAAQRRPQHRLGKPDVTTSSIGASPFSIAGVAGVGRDRHHLRRQLRPGDDHARRSAQVHLVPALESRMRLDGLLVGSGCGRQEDQDLPLGLLRRQAR